MNDDVAIALGVQLERIAVSLEAIQAFLKPSDLAKYHAESTMPPIPEGLTYMGVPVQALVTGPLDPDPPFPVPVLAPSAPVPFPPMAPNWQAGMVHQNGHKPLKTNARGLYCPSRMADGTWCAWRAG